MVDYIDSYQILYQEVIDCSKELNEKSAELATTMFALSKFLEQLSELNRMIKCEQQHELFGMLSKLVTGTGNYIAKQGELFKNYLGSHLKVNLAEHESYRELFNTREAIKTQFVKRERHLHEKKEKMFRNKDFAKWGYEDPNELQRRSEELLADKEKAFKFMFQNDTQELEYAREEFSFYTNQCLNEVRRVGKDNGKLLTSHLMEMS